MTTAERLLELRLQRPFVPFRMKLKDGSTITLTERLKFAVNEYIMIVAQDRGAALRFRIDQVDSIEMLEPIS